MLTPAERALPEVARALVALLDGDRAYAAARTHQALHELGQSAELVPLSGRPPTHLLSLAIYALTTDRSADAAISLRYLLADLRAGLPPEKRR